ncbi:SDR family NAD(P)-dependent oxidoreductase [Paraburkholderia sediminicola]|uniref:SDR family NAD(P)-dependent oxidoreductase n=1 Tax=Paraburkholderia TaxID=1822464 RepID=UPI0038BA3AF9
MVSEDGVKRRVAIVTGGARGLGSGIARRLAKDGFDIVLWDIHFDENQDADAGFTPILQQTVNVAAIASVTRAFEEVLKKVGTVEVLVKNAGINGPICASWDYPLDQWQRVLDVNLTGVFNCCRAVVPHLIARGYGRIVNIASVAGKEGNPNNGAYAAAKGGVIAFTKSPAKELASSGVSANCIAPTMAETDLLKQMTPEFIASIKAKIPMGRLVRIEEVAAMAAWIASPECSFTTGFTFDITGGRATY